MSQLKKQGIRALIWDLSGKFFSHGIAFLFSIFLTRLLDPSDFGLIAMVLVYAGIAGVFADMGLGEALIQKKDPDNIDYTSVFYFNLAVGLSLTLVTFFSARLIGDFYGYEELIPVTEIMSLTFVFGSLGSVQAVRLRRELKYGELAKARLSAAIVSGAVGVALALFGAGVYSLVAQTLLMSILFSGFVWFLSDWAPGLGFSFHALRQLWGFGFRMFLVTLLNEFSMRLDVLVVGKLFPAATLGFYDLAKRTVALVNQYNSGSLMSVMFPVLSRIQHENERFNRIVSECLNLVTPLAFVISGVIFLSADQLITFLFSEKWLHSAIYLKLLILGSYSYPINALLVNVLRSKGNSRGFLRMALFKKVVFFCNMAVAFQWGIEGYLIGLIVVGVINTAITIVFASYEIEVEFRSMARPIVYQGSVFIVALVVSYLVGVSLTVSPGLGLLAAVSVFLVVFVGVNAGMDTASWRSARRQFIRVPAD